MTPPGAGRGGADGGGAPRRGGNQGPRKSNRKGPSVGSGGHGRRRLEGKGPTPKAEDRPGHPAARRARAADRDRTGGPRAADRSDGAGQRGRSGGRRPHTDPDAVIGRAAVVEALTAGVPARALVAAAGLEVDQRVRTAVRLAKELGIPLREAPRGELDALAAGGHHQGLVLTVAPYDYADPADLLDRAADAGEPALIVALDSVTDPRNLGAVVRSAAAFGAHGVVVPARRAAGMTAGAWKASAGAAAQIPVARATNLARTLRAYADAGLTVAGLDGEGRSELSDLDGSDPLVLVVGAEDRGLSRLVGERCTVRVRIPLATAVESLNAAVAAGIALHAVATQRRPR